MEHTPGVPDIPPPRPLPVPEPTGLLADRRVRVGLIVGVVLAVVLTLAACGFAVAGLDGFMAELGPTFGGLDSGVVRMQWAGDGRYAIVEYVGSGVDGTTSVISWDSVTGRTARADGYRLVAAEASSTQVWLSRAPDPETLREPDMFEGEISPWDEPAWMGAPVSDGPGTPWVWDAASRDAPVRPETAQWRPWTGPAGVTASLTVRPDTGLWPASMSFTSTAAAPVDWQAEDAGTFLPLGWSASGRYFAVWRAADYEDGTVVVIDATSGEAIAEDIDPVDATRSGDEPSSSFGGIAGAAWDTAADSLWVLRYDTTDDGNTYRVRVATLTPGGGHESVAGVPSQWHRSTDQPVLLGADREGLLIGVEEDDIIGLWRAHGDRIAWVGVFDTEEAWLEDSGAYSGRGMLLVRAHGDTGAFGGQVDPAAAVCDLTGRGVRTFWPQR